MASLKRLIIEALEQQGFTTTAGDLSADLSQKDRIRRLHTVAVTYKRDSARPHLASKEQHLLQRFASGHSLAPEKITPRLKLVLPGTEDELLFRYASLQWSIPISSGYGRRLRFLVLDDENGKLIGLIGLGDPVFSLSGRDAWVGWDHEARRTKLRHVMDAFVLGAVPPYSHVLGGKLVAALAASDEVREAFAKKYRGSTSLIGGSSFDGRLALVTTTSALGRSSIYNRLSYAGQPLYLPVGWTQGSGDFQFANGLYKQMAQFACEHFEPTAKHADWGTGFRNRREIVKRCLRGLNLSPTLLYHGVRREIFVVPLAHNTPEFLRGEHCRLRWYTRPCDQISDYCKRRWMIPRASRDHRYRDFVPQSLSLWT